MLLRVGLSGSAEQADRNNAAIKAKEAGLRHIGRDLRVFKAFIF